MKQQLLQHIYKNTGVKFQAIVNRNVILKEKSLFSLIFLRQSITFAEKCPEVYLSCRSYIRYKHTDASTGHTIRGGSMLAGRLTKSL